MECVGTERSIVNCLHSNWTVNDCHHNEDAGVACTSESVCVCVCVYLCLNMYIHTHVCMRVRLCACEHMCMSVV